MVCLKKLVRNGVLSIVGSILIFFIVFPKVIRWQIKKQFTLKDGTTLREMWTVVPFPIDFKIYIFNVTNPEEVENGQKPKLKEVGPFFYDQYKKKLDLVDREEDDTVEYNIMNTWIWNSEKSNGLTGEEEVIVPHLVILSMIMVVISDNPSATDTVEKAINSVFHEPKSVFVKVKAKDILFGGLPIDCTVTDFAGSTICNALQASTNDLVPDEDEEEGHFKISFFGAKNATAVPERIRVLRGIKNYKDLGRVVEVDGESELNVWSEDSCNAFSGTDSTVFPPFLTKEENVITYTYELCRSIVAHYVGPSKTKGLNTLKYTVDMGDPIANPAERCFCTDENKCLGKNLFEMQRCLGVPVVGSLPHFYDSDKKYVEMVEGLNPNKEDHEIFMYFEPMTGIPIIAYTKLQFNMFTYPIPDLKLMRNFSDVLLPLFWIEGGLILADEYVNLVKLLFLLISIINFLKWTVLLAGIGMFCAAGYYYYENLDYYEELYVTKVSPKDSDKTDPHEDKKEKSWPPNMKINTIKVEHLPVTLDRS